MFLLLVALNVLLKCLTQIFSKSKQITNLYILRNHLYVKNSVKSYCISFSLNVVRIIIALHTYCSDTEN